MSDVPIGTRVHRKPDPFPELVSPPDEVREALVRDLAERLLIGGAFAPGTEARHWVNVTDEERELFLSKAEITIKLLELRGMLSWPAQRRFRVVIDDPEMLTRHEYEVTAPTIMAALFTAARRAILDDPTGGMAGQPERSLADRTVMSESLGLVEGVAMYGDATPLD